jgi:hypothetical protein
MSWRPAPAWTFGALCAALAVALSLGAEWNRRLVIPPVGGQIVAKQSSEVDLQSDTDNQGSPRVRQSIEKLPGLRKAAYSFVDFKQDRITLSYQVPEAAFKSYNDAYGYRSEDITALQQWRDNATQSSFRLAVASGKNQAQVNAAAAAIQADYDKKLREYLTSRGFMLLKGGVTRVDVPGVVKQNKPLVKPIAQVFERFATAHRYESMAVPGHYLMAVLQIPDKGDAFVEYQGLQYILLEPAGPGWFPPGQVGEETTAQLNGSDGYQIYPFL